MNRIHSTIIAVLLALGALCGTLQAAPPTVQARNLTFSDKGSTSVKLTFLSPSGSGARSLIVVSTDNTIGTPTNGTTYTVVDAGDYSSDANPTISGDKVVGNLASPSAINYSLVITGLQPNTTYYFKVYEFNTANGNEYLTSNATNNPRSFTTYPAAPIVLNPDNLTTSSADLRWYDASGATKYLLDVYKAADANDDNIPDDLTGAIYVGEDVGDPSGNLNVYTLGGISNIDADYYFYRVYSDNSNGTSEPSSWVRFDVIEDNVAPTFTIEYFSDANMTTSLGANPALKAGTYYIRILSSEPLMSSPTISIQAPGVNNDVLNGTTVRMDNDSIYRYTRVISTEAAINGTVISDISLTGTDAAGNVATNVNPTNEATRAEYLDVVAPTAASIALVEVKPDNTCGLWGQWNANSNALEVTFDVPNDASLVGGSFAIQGVSSLSNTTYRTIHTATITNVMLGTTQTISVPGASVEAMTDFVQNATVDFRVVLTDKAGNGAEGMETGSPITVDQIAPTLSAVTIESNNANNTIAKEGDVITLRFNSSDFNLDGYTTGNVAGTNFGIGDVNSPSLGVYYVTYTVTNMSPEGAVAFTVNPIDGACNTGVAVTATTNGSSVIIDRSAPEALAPTSVVTAGGAYQNAGYWNSGNTFVNVTVPLNASDATLDGGSIQLWADANDAGAGNAVGFTHVITTAERAAGSVTLQIPDIEFESITDFEEGDVVTFNYVITDRAGNSATSPASASTLTVDRVAPASYTVEYFSNSTLTNSLGLNPVIGPGTYYVKITSSEPLFDNPSYRIDAPCGTEYDVTNLTTSEAVSNTTFRFTRTIPANGTCELDGIAGSTENIFILGTDAAGNVNASAIAATASVGMGNLAKIDTKNPSLTGEIVLGTTPTANDAVTFTLTFDEPVNFQTANVSLNGTLASAAYVSDVTNLGGNQYQVTVTMNDPNTNGTIGITVENTVKDDHNNYFEGGELATSELYTIDNNNPTIASVSPSNINIGDNIEVTFSENIRLIAGGSGVVSLDDVYDADDRSGADFTLTVSGNKLIINPVNDLNNDKTYGLRIGADLIEDLSGNDFAGLSDNSVYRFTTPDTQAPTATVFSPLDNATAIARDANLTVSFSEPVRFTSNGTVTIYNTDNNNIIAQYNVGTPGTNLSILNNVLTINPSNDLPNYVNVAVQISNNAIEDVNGNDFAGILNNTTWNFLTVDNVAPTFTGMTPGNNDIGVARNSDLVINFSENVQAGNNTNARFNIRRVSDGTYFASYKATDGQVNIAGSTVTVNPTNDLEDNAQYYVEIGEGFVQDANGAANQFAGFSGTTTWKFTTRDESAPTLTEKYPAHDAIDVALNQNFIFTFSEPVYRGTGNIVLRLDGGADFETFNAATTTRISGWGTNQLTLDPTNNLLGPDGGNVYEIVIPNTAIKDASNNFYGGLADDEYHIYTVDATSPTLAAINAPADNATGVQDDANLVFTLSENVVKGTGNIEIRRTSDNSVFETISVGSAKVAIVGAQVTINPAGSFEHMTGYYVYVPATAFKDSYNNFFAGITDATSWNFTSEDLQAPIVASTNPANNATGVAHNADFVITFDENIALNTTASNTGLIEIREAGTNALKESFAFNGVNWVGNHGGTATVLGNSITLDPNTDLTNNIQYYILVNGAAIADANGNFWAGYNLPSQWSFRALDNVAPIAVTLTPLDNATEVNETVNLSVVFDEPIQKGAGNVTLTKTNAPNAGSTSYDISQNWITITGGNTLMIDLPSNLISSGAYQVTIDAGAIEDISGNDAAQIGGGANWNFSVRDYMGPQVSTRTPDQNTTSASMTNDFVLNFDENVVRGSGNIKIYKSGSNELVETISVTDVLKVNVTGSTVTINPANNLTEKTSYYVTIDASAFRDAANNNFAGFTGTTDWTFRTVDLTAPTAAFTPADASTGVNVTDNFIITFDEPVVKGSGNITITGGAQTIIIDVTGSQVTISNDGLTATINPTADLSNFQTEYTITMPAGVFEDIAGNDFAAVTNTMWNFFTQDIEAPVTDNFTPANGATNVARNSNLTVSFSENVKRGSTGTVQIRKYSDNSLVESFNYNSTALTFSNDNLTINPTNDLAENTRYYVTITSGTVLDESNNAFAGINSSATWNFTTVDETAPVLTDLAPNDNAVNVALNNNLVLTFNENITAGGSPSISLYDGNGNLVETITSLSATSNPADGAAGYAANRLYVNPTNSLNAETSYYVMINGTTVVDASNNAWAGISNNSTWNFTTLDNLAPTITSLSPADNSIDVNQNADFVITFSENVKQGYGTIKLWKDLGTDQEIESIQLPTNDSRITVAGNQVTINWNATLDSEGDYYVEVINAAGLAAFEDLAGNDAPAISSGAWSIRVDDYVAPLMTATSPLDNAIDVQDDENITLTFDDNVAIGSMAGTITLRNCSDNSIVEEFTYSDFVNGIPTNGQVGFSGNTVTINPTNNYTGSTCLYLNVSANAIADDSENFFAGISNATTLNFTTEDLTAPTLTALTPANNSVTASRTANLTMTFSENVIKGTGNITIRSAATDAIFDQIDVTTGDVTVTNNVASINFDPDFTPNAQYYVTVDATAFRDANMNYYAGFSDKVTWAFTTVDDVAPILSTLIPNDEATAVANNANLLMTFNEAVKAGTGNIVIYNVNTPVETIDVTNTARVQFSGNQVTIDPANDFASLTTLNVRMASGVIRDLANNNYAGISDATTWNFTTADNAAPQISSTTPANLATNVGVSSNIVLTFNENVTANAGNVYIRRVSDNSTWRTVDVTSAEVTVVGNQVTINPAVDFESSTQYYVDIEAGSFKDANNNGMSAYSGLSSLRFTTADIVAPYVISFNPTDNATGVKRNGIITLTFNENVQVGTGGTISVLRSSDNAEMFNVTIPGETVTNATGTPTTDGTAAFVTGGGNTVRIALDSASLSDNVEYYVNISNNAIRDIAGNFYQGINSTTLWSFTTGDATAPTFTFVTPADNAVNVNETTTGLTFTLSEAVTKGSGNIYVRKSSDNSVVETINVNSASVVIGAANTVTVDLNNSLLASQTAYYVTMDNGVFVDANANTTEGWTATGTWNFTTGDNIAPLLTGRNPAQGATDVLIGANIVLTFDDSMLAGTGNILLVNNANNNVIATIPVGDAQVTGFGTNTITINPTADLPGSTTVAVRIASGVLKDDQNNAFAGLTGADYTFTTHETNAPTITNLSPVDNAAIVPVADNFAVTFNENVIYNNAGSIYLYDNLGNVVEEFTGADIVNNATPAAGQAGWLNNQLVINPSNNLTSQGQYNVRISNNIFRDQWNNLFAGITDATTWNFTAADVVAPTVSAYSPADNTTGVAPNSNLTLTFNENVQRGTAGDVVIYNGNGTIFETIPYSDVNRLTFAGTTLTINPNVDLASEGSYYVQIGANAVRDMQNNYFAGIADATTWNFTTADVIAPTIVSTSPSDNTANNAANTNLYITFSENIVKGTGNITIMRHNQGGDDTVIETIPVTGARVTVTNNVAIIDPTSDLPNAFIYVLAGNGTFKDASNNNFAGISDTTFWNFTVGDVMPPTIISTTPADNATEVLRGSNLTVNFNESIEKGLNTGYVRIRRASDDQIFESIAITSAQIVVSGSSVTIDPTNLLNYNTGYYVEISNDAIRDLNGNYFAGISGNGTWNFTTEVGDTVRPSLTSFMPADESTNVNENDNFVLNFSEAVTPVAGKNIVIYRDNGTTFETIAATSATVNGTQVTIPVSMFESEGSYYVNIDEGAFEDSFGNDSYVMTGNTTWNFRVRDYVAPTVSTLSPADNATNVLVGSNLVLTFNENVKKGTSGNITIVRTSDNQILATIPVTDSRVSVSGMNVTINPDTLNYNTAYHILVENAAILDMNNNAFAGISVNTTWNFTTEIGDVTPPAALTLTPADNSTNVVKTSDLTIRFSENVTPVAGKFIKVYNAGTNALFASVEATDAVKDLDSIYTINLPDLGSSTAYYVQIDAGAFVDRFNNQYAGISTTTDWNFTAEDYIAPTVSSFSPADNATGVLIGSNLVANFDEAVFAGSANVVIYRQDGQVFESIPVTDARISINGSQVTINPSLDLAYNTGYYVNVPATALRDAANNFFAGFTNNTTWNFTSEVGDITPPALTSTNPSDNANTAMIDGDITLTFDENVAKGTSGNIVIYRASDDEAIETIPVTDARVSVNGSVVTINPSTTLSNATAYYVQVANGAIEDMFDNAWAGIADKTTLNFTTLPELATEPAAVTNLSKVRSDANQLTFRWKPNHTSKKVIVVGRKGTASSQYNINIDTTLLDGHDFNFNTTSFGQSPADSITRTDNINSTHWVAYKGTDTVITVGGLTGLTGYTFAVYAYDEIDGDPLTRNYNETRVQIKLKTSKEGVEETEVAYGNDLFEVTEVAPNPVQTEMNFTVSSNNDLNYDIELYTSTGELVMKPYSNYAFGAGEHNVRIPLVTKGQLAAGSYLLRVSAGGMVITQTVVVMP